VRAFIIEETGDVATWGVREYESAARQPSDVLVKVEFSGVNFKDAMVAASPSRIRRSSRLVGGVDAAGIVLESADPVFRVGTRVAVHGGDLGVGRDGGFGDFVYAPTAYLSALPDTISTRSAMIIGTAGFTAMASVLALEYRELDRDGEILVTGATGGVGSFAVTLLAARGYRVVASTGAVSQAAWLRERGAERIINRTEISERPDRVLDAERWAGAIDCIGGDTLHQILRSLRYGASVAASGLVAGSQLTTTVYPFITRAVNLLGIDAVQATSKTRHEVWSTLGALAPTLNFEPLTDRVVSLDGIEAALEVVRSGATRGRILVDLATT
jgi:acrylyl-CoA reductase (NADPH)